MKIIRSTLLSILSLVISMVTILLTVIAGIYLNCNWQISAGWIGACVFIYADSFFKPAILKHLKKRRKRRKRKAKMQAPIEPPFPW